MRRIAIACLWLLLMPGVPRTAGASDGFDGLVQVVKSGADLQTLTNYVNASPIPYALTVDEILYLSDLGLPAETIRAIAAHGVTTDATAQVTAVLSQAEAIDEPTLPPESPEPPEAAPPAREVVQETVVEPPVVTAPPTNAVDYSTFYEALAPYGNWLDVDGEWSWQPTAVLVSPGWSPYCQHGRWVYSDCGWVWTSSYSWGWAPFHYGRWRRHSRYGWLWHPGTVWGPAWVCWRYSDAAVGWAPLPPDITFDPGAGLCFQGRPVPPTFDCGLTWVSYVFVPIQRFGDIGVARHRFRRAHAEQVFHEASVVQNRITFQQGRVCNVGPPPRHITVITHQEIRPVTVMDHRVRQGDRIPPATLSGPALSVYRPAILPIARETPRQVVLRREARDRERRDTDRHDDTFRVDRASEAWRGVERRGPESHGMTHLQPAPAVTAPVEMPRPEAFRRAREDAARLEESQQRARDAARQMEDARRAQEAIRRQQFARDAEIAARAAEAQRQMLRARREAEEQVARQQEDQARAKQNAASAAARQRGPASILPEVGQDYDDDAATDDARRRGPGSRDSGRHSDKR